MTNGSVELRTEFAEGLHWAELAKKRGIRLPLWRMPITSGGMRKYLKKLGVEVEQYLEYNNEKNLREFAKRNPEWPLRAWVGLLLEGVEYYGYEVIPLPKKEEVNDRIERTPSVAPE